MTEWIEWDGTNGGHPETLDTCVEVKFRDGDTSDEWEVGWFYGTGEPSDNNWFASGGDWDIVAYRVVNDV